MPSPDLDSCRPLQSEGELKGEDSRPPCQPILHWSVGTQVPISGRALGQTMEKGVQLISHSAIIYWAVSKALFLALGTYKLNEILGLMSLYFSRKMEEPGKLQSMGLQRLRHHLSAEQQQQLAGQQPNASSSLFSRGLWAKTIFTLRLKSGLWLQFL